MPAGEEVAAMMNDLILGHAPRQQMAARIAALSWRPDVECYYFGCIGGPGHYMHKRGARHAYNDEDVISAAFGGIDGKLCWNSKPSDYSYNRDETEGRALLTHKGGWTAIAFWDQSVDKRGACNSAFFVRGELTFAQMVRVARHQWPQVWARFTFEVVEVDRSGREIP